MLKDLFWQIVLSCCELKRVPRRKPFIFQVNFLQPPEMTELDIFKRERETDVTVKLSGRSLDGQKNPEINSRGSQSQEKVYFKENIVGLALNFLSEKLAV